MPLSPHIEKHFTASETVRDIVIGMSDGLTVPFALAAGLSGAVASSGIIVTAGLAETLFSLPPWARELVAKATSATVTRDGMPRASRSPLSLPDDLVLQEQRLPGQLEWDTAVVRAGQIFGEAPSPLLKASTVAGLSSTLKKKATDSRAAGLALCERLKDRMTKQGIEPAVADRMKTASATQALVDRLNACEAAHVVSMLATAAIATPEARVRRRPKQTTNTNVTGTSAEVDAAACSTFG